MKNSVLIKNKFPISFYIILAFGILLRLPNFNENLWFDELWSTKIILGNIGNLFHQIWFDIHPPFYPTFMFFWIRLFGDSEISIRIQPFVFGILSIFLTYAVALKYTEKKTALLTSFLLCVSPVHIWYSQEARHFTTVLFFILASIFSYSRLREPKANPIWYLVYFGSLFLAVFTHYCAFVFLLLFLIICLFKVNKVKRNILILNFLILACLVSFLTLKIALGTFRVGIGYLRPFTPFELWMLFFNWFLFGNSLWNINPYTAQLNAILQKPAFFCSQIFFLVIFTRGLILNFKNSKNLYGLYIILYLFSLPLFVLGLTFVGFKHVYIERGLFIILPFFYIILAKGATGFKTKVTRTICTGIVILFSIAALIGFFRKADEWTVYKHNPDWRSAANYFCGKTKNTEKPLFIFVVIPVTELTYYYTRLEKRSQSKKITLPRLQIYQISSLQGIHNLLSTNNIKMFYLIKIKFWIGNFNDLLKNLMKEQRFQFINSQSFKGLEILEFKVALPPL